MNISYNMNEEIISKKDKTILLKITSKRCELIWNKVTKEMKDMCT